MLSNERRANRIHTNQALRAIIAAGLSLAMALGGAPAAAFAETNGDTPISIIEEQPLEAQGVDEIETDEDDGALPGKDEGAADVGDEIEETATEAGPTEDVSEEEPVTPVEEIALEESDIEMPTKDARPKGLEAQAATRAETKRSFPLNGPGVKISSNDYRDNNPIYTFTLSRASRVKFELQCPDDVEAEASIWDSQSRPVGSLQANCDLLRYGNTFETYLAAGTYTLKPYMPTRLFCDSTGEMSLRGVVSSTAYPTRESISTKESAMALKKDTTIKSLFVENGASEHYYKITVPDNKDVEITCENTDPDCPGALYASLLDSNDQYAPAFKNGATQVSAPQPVREAGKTALKSGGTYYIRVSAGYNRSTYVHGGPYTIRWTTLDPAPAKPTTKATNPMTAKATKASVSATYKPKATTTTACNVTVSKAQGTVTYTNASTGATAQKFTVNRTSGKVTLPKATKAGTYTVKVKVSAAGNSSYKSASKTVTYKIVVKKATNPITATAVARTASFSTLKSKAVTVARPMKVTGAVGTKTYAKVESGSSSRLTVNKDTGKVTVKKGTKKGTYTIKIKLTATGGTNYKSGSKTVTCKVTVK